MVLRRSFPVHLAFALLLAGTLSAQVPPKREFRAAWIATVANLDWPSSGGVPSDVAKAQLVTILDKLKANGISAVIFQVRSECDAMYPSTLEPWSYYLTGGQGVPPSPFYDPLQFAVEQAHMRGMEIHAWFNPYRAYRQTNTYQTAANHVTKAHPGWVITCPDGYKFLDPGLPEVRDHVARVMTDVVRRYDVDGIHCDDYFYPYPEHSFTNEDASTFATYPRGFANLGNWRRDNVNLLLRMVRDSLNLVAPHIKFGMSPFGIWQPGYPPGIVGLNAYADIYCDAMAWLRDGSIDYLTPQLYWPTYQRGQEYTKLMPWWGDSTSKHGRHLYTGNGAYRIPNWNAGEMPLQIRLNRANPKVSGEVYFRANQGVNDNPLGFADSLRTSYYRYPVLHPVMAWKDTVPPNPPRAIRYAALPGTGAPAIQWDAPFLRPGDDSASRYAIYRFDHYPSLSELDDPRNLLSVEGRRTYTPPVPPGGPSAYYFAVTALDRNYNESDTSNILLFAQPLAPVLQSPADGSESLPDTLKVVWRASQSAFRYHLQVATDPGFAAGIVLDDSTVTDTSKSVTNMFGQKTHYWRVSASSPGGESPYSDAYRFVTGFPPAAILLSPPDVQVDVPLNIRFAWRPAPGAQSYRLQLSKSSTFVSTVLDSAGIVDTVASVDSLTKYTVYFWRVKARNTLGTSEWSTTFRFRTMQLVPVAEEEGLPESFDLSQNYPNPFNPLTTIRFAVPQASHITMSVYDVLGREAARLVDDDMAAGVYTIRWDASSFPSGVYFYRLIAGSFAATRRMLLVK